MTWAAISKVIYSLWVSAFPPGNVVNELFFACCQYRDGPTRDLSACEAPHRTRLLLCPGLGVFFSEILPITQVETPAGVSWEVSGGFQLSSNLCQASRAHREAVTSPKPCLHLSLQQILPGNGSNPVNPPARGSTPTPCTGRESRGCTKVLHIANLVLLRVGRCPNISLSSVSTLCFLGRKAQVFS